MKRVKNIMIYMKYRLYLGMRRKIINDYRLYGLFGIKLICLDPS